MSAARKPTSRKKSSTKAARKTRTTGVRRTSDKKSAAKKKTAAKATKSGSGKAVGKTPPKSTADRKKTARKATSRASATGASRDPARTKTAAAKKSAARRSDKLDAKTMTKLRDRLVEERRGLLAEMAELEEESFQTTQSDITGEAGVDEDFADAGTATFDREQALSIANNIRDLIEQVDRALARMEEGTYGSCERCGRTIDPVRLRALPRTLLCTECKRREERAR
jgi:RNA polymerase-binding transcription factor DksA